MEFEGHPLFPDFLFSLINTGAMEKWLDYQTSHEDRKAWFGRWVDGQ